MCRPAGGAGHREDRREGLPGDAQRIEQDRGEKFHIGVEWTVGLFPPQCLADIGLDFACEWQARAAAGKPLDGALQHIAGEGLGFRGAREERAALDLSGPFATAKDRAIDRFESAYLAALMRRCAGNLSLAAREADVARNHLRDLLKKRGLYGASWLDPKDDA